MGAWTGAPASSFREQQDGMDHSPSIAVWVVCLVVEKLLDVD
jgi:hypothetical protein